MMAYFEMIVCTIRESRKNRMKKEIMQRLERWFCARLVKAEKQKEAWNNVTPWSNLISDQRV